MLVDFNLLNINTLLPETDFDKEVKKNLLEWESPSSTVKVSTSGSTGIPKILEVEKSRMRNSAKMTCEFLGLKPGDIALLCLPIQYISGKMMVVRARECQLKLLVKDSTLEPLRDLQQPVDFCAMTPLQVERSLEKIHLIKNLIIGGAGVSESLQQKIKETLDKVKAGGLDVNTRIFETYGMSETLSHIALKELYPNPQEAFTLFEGVSIDLDERGALRIVAPKLTSEVLQTNDLVEIHGETKFKFLGRTDNVINSAGAKIRPEELEGLLKKEISRELVFAGQADQEFGERLVLVVEGEDSNKVRSQIQDAPFEKKFHKPKAVYFLKELPRTPNGKISRIKLKAWLQDQNR